MLREGSTIAEEPFAPILVSPLSQTALHCLEPLHLGLVDVQREGGAVLQKFVVRQVVAADFGCPACCWCIGKVLGIAFEAVFFSDMIFQVSYLVVL